MISKTTASRFVGLVFLVAALSSGTANAAGTTAQGLKADGLRLTGLAERYQAMKGYTQQGLKADGLRWKGMAQAYANRADRPAASFYTPQALKAEGLRWQALARSYAKPQPQVVHGNSFDWGAAGIGAIGVFGLLLCAAVQIGGIRRIRQEKLAV